jgi:hypothetical protein
MNIFHMIRYNNALMFYLTTHKYYKYLLCCLPLNKWHSFCYTSALSLPTIF